MDKLHTNKIEVTIETQEGICDVVESIIKYGQEACKHRWLVAEVLLDFLDLPSLDPIDQVISPKLKLEEMERNFSTTKD